MHAALRLDDAATASAAPQSAWRGRPAARVMPSRRFLTWLGAGVVAATLATAVMARGLPDLLSRYSVSVPVTLVRDMAARGVDNEAALFADALANDPDLPDPFSVGLDGATTAPPVDPAQLRESAFVGPAAQPFVLKPATPGDRARAHYCLTAAIYYEAASETDDGMRGVAQTVINRMRHPSFPNSVCGVVFQGSQRPMVCQFTFSCDGAMARRPGGPDWARASRIANEALSGRVFPSVGLATHYHTQAIWPRWGKSLVMTNIVGAHIFHRWRGRHGMPNAFTQRHSGHEPAPGPYLPVAQQLAFKAGRGLADPLATFPGVIGAGPLAALPAAVPVAPVAPPPMPGAAAAPAIRAAPPATYDDPRLNQSGSVRDEFRDSGTWIK